MGNHKDCFGIMKLWNFLVFGLAPKPLVQVSLSDGQLDYGRRLNSNDLG